MCRTMFSTITTAPSTTIPKSNAPNERRLTGTFVKPSQMEANSNENGMVSALTIPFSLLFASIWLGLTKVPVNLLSLGALDFGMVVDGAVVMVENIVRHMTRRQSAEGTPKSVAETIRDAAHEVQRPVFYAIVIIITAYLPIFTLERIEGRLFRPMAWTVAFSLLGAMTFSILLAPVLSSALFRKGVRERRNPIMEFLTVRYRRRLRWAI